MGPALHIPVAVVGIPLVLLLFFFHLFSSFCFFYCMHVLFTTLYSCMYVLGTFDKTSDIVSCGTVPRTFVQDTVVCWLVATTVCSCGFRTIDIVWRGPVLLVPGFPRGWWMSSSSWFGSVHRPDFGRLFTNFPDI